MVITLTNYYLLSFHWPEILHLMEINNKQYFKLGFRHYRLKLVTTTHPPSAKWLLKPIDIITWSRHPTLRYEVEDSIVVHNTVLSLKLERTPAL